MTGFIGLAELLPAVYRLRDEERAGPLTALLALVDEQAGILRDDIAGLWDDLFIETASEWAIPYIGDLVSNNALHEGVAGRRADVARTIWYRRRKGIVPMLERLTRDVTGWDARVVPTFELLAWNQNANHLRPGVATADVRDLDAMDLLGGPFERTAHTPDVRTMTRHEGRYGIRKVAFFTWRLESFPLAEATARRVAAADPARYTFSQLGAPTPLFTFRQPPPDDEEVGGELSVRSPIRPMAFYSALVKTPPRDDWYGPARSVFVDGVPLADIRCRDLVNWDAPEPGTIAIDVRLGRLMFAADKLPTAAPTVRYCYGFPARIGGGPYSRLRAEELAPAERRSAPPDLLVDPVGFDRVVHVGAPGEPATVGAAIASWVHATEERLLVQIADNAIHRLPAGGLELDCPEAGRDVVIQAADGFRPVLDGDIVVKSLSDGALSLDGFVLEGRIRLTGELGRLDLRHATLVPGAGLRPDGLPRSPGTPAIEGAATAQPRVVTIDRSICGPIVLDAELHDLTIRDSIVDAPKGGTGRVAIGGNAGGSRPGPAATILRSTIFGDVVVRELVLGSDSIFAAGALRCERRQSGCVRFSWLDSLVSSTPRRYRCQPDLALEQAAPAEEAAVRDRVRPSFTSTRYGEPAYAQLADACPPEIAEGADNATEMGVYSRLRQPQREANLRLRLDEYLPFGLEPGIVHVT